jgi:hypothetical protein
MEQCGFKAVLRIAKRTKGSKIMSKLEELEQKLADTKAAYTVAYVDADIKAAYVTAETKAALAAYKAAYDAYEDAEAAYVKAVDELKEYKEQDNE